MSFFQRLLGGSQQAARKSRGGGGGGEPTVAPDDLVDVCFDEGCRNEAELAALLQSYERAQQLDREVAREVLLNFFDRFAATCAVWKPEPSAIIAARAAAAAEAARADAGGAGGRAHVQMVRGCSGGHPRALLAAAVECLERSPKALSQAAAAASLASPPSSVHPPAPPPKQQQQQQDHEASEAAVERQIETASGEGAAGRSGGQQQQLPSVQQQALLQGGGLPVLRALRVLLRSKHNRAVLVTLGLLPALCDLSRQLAQKLQAAAGVLAVRSSSGSLASLAAATPAPPASPSKLRSAGGGGGQQLLLEPLMVLLQATLAVVQAFIEHEAAHQQQHAAMLAGRGSSKATSHAALAASQQSALAAAMAAAAAATAAAVAPLLEGGLLERCCNLLPVLTQILLHSSTANAGRERAASHRNADSWHLQQCGGGAVAAAMATERRALLCLLAFLAASPGASSAVLAQTRGGHLLELLAGMLGWPLAPADQQPLPLSSSARVEASGSSGSLFAASAAQQPAEELSADEEQRPDGLRDSYTWVNSGGGLRPASQELALQLLLLRVLGAACCAAGGGGAACLRLVVQQGGFARITQVLQWCALTFDAGDCGRLSSPCDAQPAAAEALSKAPPVPSPSGAAISPPDSPKSAELSSISPGSELTQLFQALWSWLAGGAGTGTGKALLSAMLAAVLAAFRPEAPAGVADAAAANAGTSRQAGSLSRSGSPAATDRPLALSAASASSSRRLRATQLFHEAALDALCGEASGAAGAGVCCACGLQQQVLLLAARLMGREQRILPLLPSGAAELQEDQHHLRPAGSGGSLARWSASGSSSSLSGLSSTNAWDNLQALRAAGFWELLFGPAFFFWSTPQLTAALPSPAGTAADSHQQQDSAAATGRVLQRERLRQLVLAVLEAAASLPATSSNLAELSALLALLQQHPDQHAVTAAACRLLLRLLGSAPATSLAALQDRQLLLLLPRLLAQQLAREGTVAAAGAQDAAEATSGGSTADETSGGQAPSASVVAAELAALEEARCAALELLGAFMSMHVSLQRAALAAWEPVAALFSLLLRPACPSRRLALDNVLLLMQVPPASEDDRLAKAALYTKYTETLPAAVRRWRELGTPLLLELLGGMRAAVDGGGGGSAGNRVAAQRLFAQSQGFLQVCNVLNEEYTQEAGPELCCCVLDTLTVLLAGSPANRRALAESVGYGLLLEAIVKRLGGKPPPRRLLLCATGLLLEETPGPGELPRFASSAIANPAALPLMLALLRRAADQDQLWGLAAFRELLLQGAQNLAAAEGAGLNGLLIEWLAATTAQEPAAAALAGDGSRIDAAAAGPSNEADVRGGPPSPDALTQRLMLQQQLLALLRVSGSYSISARDLRSLLHLLKPSAEGVPPQQSAMLLEALAAMASHEGPRCFFNFSGGGSGSSSNAGDIQPGPGQQHSVAQAARLPSGIVCSASLGGGTGGTGNAGGTSSTGSSSAASFLLLPRSGYSFAAWLRLEDGRGAAEQLAEAASAQSFQSLLLSQQQEMSPGAVAAATAAAAAVATDQAVYALLHLPHSASQQLMHGVALAVRAVHGASEGTAGGTGSFRGGPALQLVAHCWAPKHSEAVLPLQQPLVPGRWHHVALTHSAGGALSHPALHLYLDGVLQATARLRYPSIKEPLSSVCLGTGALMRHFRGQAGAALLFEDVLAPGQVAALHQLGPDYQSPLLGASESSGLLDQHPAAAAALALGGEGGGGSGGGGTTVPGQPPKLLLAFCPQAAAAAEDEASRGSGAGARHGGRAIREAVQGLPAALLADTQLCRTMQPRDMLHCLGGVAVLLPLLEVQLGPGAVQEQALAQRWQPGRLSWPPSGDPRAGVLRLLAAMLRGSPTNQQAMQEIGGFSLAAHLLEQAPHPRHVLTPELLAAQQQVLGAVGESSELTRDVLRHLLLNVQLWGTAAPAVQLQVLALWCQLAQGEPQLVRLLLPPARLVHHVRRRFFSGGGASSPAYLAPLNGGGTGGAAGVAGQVPPPDAPRQLQQQEGMAAVSELPLDKPVRQQLEAQQPCQQDESGGAAEEEEEEEAAHVAELRRSHLQLAALIITQSAAAGPEQQGHTAIAAAGANPAVSSSPMSLPAEAGRPLSSHASASGGDEGLAADLQAALSLVADCCTSLAASRAAEAGASSRSSNDDAALLQELLSVLLLPVLRRGSLARLPLLACLARLGGPSLLLPVLSLDQQQLRLLGLKAIAACLSTGNTSAAGSSSQPLPTGQQQHPPQRFDPNDQLIAAAGQLLAAYQLTAPTRIALFELLCGGLPWQQIDGLAPAGAAVAPAGGAADCPGRAAGASSAGSTTEVPDAAFHHVSIKHPAAAAVLLQMAAELGCSQGERAAVLGMLCLLCESASLTQQARHGNLDMLLAAPCPWPSLLLACLADGSTPGGGKTSSSRGGAKARVEPSAQRDEVAAAAWRLLVLLLARAVVASPGGWQLLHAVAGLLKAQPQRHFSLPAASSGGGGGRSGAVEHGVSGWRLLQEVLSDVMQELLAAQAADASAVAATAASAADVPSLGVRAAPRRRSSEWDAWTLVSQWSTEPYCSNAAALLALLDDLLCGTAVTPPGISPAPSGSALLWADPAAADAVGSGGTSGNRGSEGTVPAAVVAVPDSIPAAVWRELGAIPWQQAQQQQQAQQAQQAPQEASGHLLLTAWRFLDRLHTSGAAAAAAAEAASPGSPASILLRVTRGLAGLAGLAGGNGGGADSGGGAAGLLSEQQLMLLQQRRGLLLLQRLLLQALRHSPPGLAAQAAAQAAQLLPLLLSAAGAGAGEGPAAEAAAGQLHLLLAALVQCYRDVSARSAAEQQEGQLLPLKVQQRLDACVLAANAVVDSWPAAFGLPAEPPQQAQPAARPSQQHPNQQGQQQHHQQQHQSQQQQRWPGQQGRRMMQELMQLLLPQQVVAAARQQLLFMRHCAGLHAAACPQLQQQMQAAATAQQQRAAAAEEGSRQCLGGLLAADRLRRAAGRQAAEEAVQHRRRRWRDLRRGLTSGRGLWADEERPEELHWKQDSVEDSSRRRLHLRRNYHFQRYSDTSVGVSSGGEAAAAGGERGAGASAEADEEAALLALAKLVPGALPSPAPEDDLERSEEEGEGGEEGEDRPRDNKAQAAVQQRQQQPLADDAGNKAVEDLSAADPAPQQPLDQPVQPPQQKAAGESRAAAAASLGAQAEQAPQQPDFVEPEQQAASQPVGSTQEEGHPSPSRQAQQQQQQQQRGQEHRRPPSVKDAPGPTPPRFEQQTSQDVEASAPAAVAAAASASAAEALLFSSRCSWVTPKRVLAGQLHVTPTQLHFVSDPPVSPSAAQPSASSGRGSAGAEARAAVGEVASSGGQAETGEDEEAPPPRRRHQRWQLGQLTEVHHSRFLLQPTALECFTADRSSHALFAFPSNQAMREAAAALARARPGLPVYDRRRKVEWALRLQQRWLRWEISTFEYLMGLNTLAGRTYNDLNQYPVMPWVLSDFISEALDLNDPSTFRDLSKPIGALNPRRWEFFADRFESLRGDAQSASEMPPFHYGSHYSSAGIVLFYLLRLESFTKMNRALQGGRFDHGDRLFHSVAATWQNCLDNTADVKELTPEFYYQPEFLLNANGFDLGTKQDGAAIGDVVLPPWAHGSPHEFVRVMREALEGDHVSQHMHHWIDLVFGAKQRGRAAEEACNVFYHLTYEGTVDLDAITDPALREAVEEQTRHFGQTPIQLFRRRHPPRGPPPPPALNPLLNGPDVMRRSALAAPPPKRSGVPVSGLWVTGDGRVLQLFADRTASVARWYPTSRADLGAFTFAATGGLLPDASAASLEPDPLPPRLLSGAWAAAPAGGGVAGGAAATVTQQLQYAVLHGERVVVSGGYWDCSLRAHSPEDGRLLQSLSYHKDVVTCLAASSDGQVVVTGSADTTLMVWDASTSFGKVGRGRQPVPLLPRPRCSLHGHRDAVTCVAVSRDLDLVASGAADGTLLLHSLSGGRYVRSLVLPHGVPPSLICLVPHLGVLVAHSYTDLQLHLYTVNGRRLASEDTHERLACLCPTPDGRLMLVAGTSGLVSLRWLHSLQVVLRYDGGRGPVTSLAITPEGCFLAGTMEGSLVLFAPDPRRRITRRAAVV